MPSLRLVLQKTRGLDPKIRGLYTAAMEQVVATPPQDDAWLRNAVLEFVKRNIFVKAFDETKELFNAGKTSAAYDVMTGRMEAIRKTTWEPVDRSDFFAELAQRENIRGRQDPFADSIPTNYAWLDHILSGGLSKGELGMWIAYAKAGKSTMLIQHGVACTRIAMKRCLHIVLEGSRKMVEARYDAAFSEQLYNEVKNSGIKDEAAYHRLMEEYRRLRGYLVLRGMTEKWTYTCEDIHGEISELRADGWDADMIIVDYGDLVGAREVTRSETEKQRLGFRDLKSLANRGYALWTATQAQRIEKGMEDTEHHITSAKIADCYDKVRAADFIGSLNQTVQERGNGNGVIRVFAEMYRDNGAGLICPMHADFTRMTIKELPGAVPKPPTATLEKPKDPKMKWEQGVAPLGSL